eukprot:c23969_g6_i1 orf=117-1037(+)
MEDEQDAAASAARVAKCEECNKEATKYKCPGCSFRSCSLPCVRAHKQRTSCSGKRDRTAFVPIASFDDTHLLSDYNLLEEVLMHSESARRFRAPFNTWQRAPNDRLMFLKRQAKGRRINLVYLPRGMTKRIENSSWYCRRRKCIFWRIEWKFHSTEFVLVNASADENESPAMILEKQLNKGGGFKTDRLRKLRKFCRKPIETMRFLLAKEMCQGMQRKYIELDPLEPFGSQLDQLSIIEYPTILVVSPCDDTKFAIVEDRRSRNAPVKADVATEGLLANIVEADGVPYREEEIEEGEIVDDSIQER